jgi:hypothetical protein
VERNERLNLQGNLYNSLGLLMLEQRFTKGAEQNLDQALALARLLKDSHLEGTVLRNLSIAARQREITKALASALLPPLKSPPERISMT